MRLLLVINSNSIYGVDCTVFQLWLIICQFSLATGEGALLFNSLAGVIPCEYCHKWHTAKTRFFRLHFTRRMYRCIFSHFYVMGPESHLVRLSGIRSIELDDALAVLNK